jgi:hypothetical protein
VILALLQNTRRLCGVLRRTFSDSILQEGARRATRRAEPSRAKPSRADKKKKKNDSSIADAVASRISRKMVNIDVDLHRSSVFGIKFCITYEQPRRKKPPPRGWRANAM